VLILSVVNHISVYVCVVGGEEKIR
jgi:hypothetical protein